MTFSKFLPRGLPILQIWVDAPIPLRIMAILMLVV